MPITFTDNGRRQIKMIKPLGKGGFGAVYLADVRTPEGLIQRMAVKILHEEFANDQAIAARARDEARLMSQLNHDHVVKVHALTRIGGRAAVLMEYVEGIDCSALLGAAEAAGGQGLPLTVAAGIVERAASALHAAWHRASPQTGQPLRVVHRDIKPSNLLVSVAGAVKVMDFGVARGDFEREAATESVQYGTHRYMAPERWLYGEAGPESDVYSLGVTFWELLTGGRFERLPLVESSFITRREAQLDPLSALPQLDAEAAPAVRELLTDMLAFDPKERASAHAVEERLATLLEDARGPSLRRYARQIIPPLVQARERSLAQDSEVEQLTNSLMFTHGDRSQKPLAKVADEGGSQRAVIGVGLLSMLLVVGLGGLGAWAFMGSQNADPVELVDDPADPLTPPVDPDAEPLSQPPDEPVADAVPAPAPAPAGPEAKASDEPKGGVRRGLGVLGGQAGGVVTPDPEPTPDPTPDPTPTPTPTVVVTPTAQAPVKVKVQLLGKPVFETASVAGRVGKAFEWIEIPVGEHVVTFTFKDDANPARCEVVVHEGLTSIKWDGDRNRCTLK
ncbi:MAG: serine/threonine protein kinase [Alphaproteobacteria bacterium]|nr:serine/threonine protein kinase [Alphaproteobacteria bacterium]